MWKILRTKKKKKKKQEKNAQVCFKPISLLRTLGTLYKIENAPESIKLRQDYLEYGSHTANFRVQMPANVIAIIKIGA